MPACIRIDRVKCRGCQKYHDITIPFPAYPSRTYVFKCPESNNDMAVIGVPLEAHVILQSIPSGCIEAKEV